jgi:hypothetical protein
LAYTARTACLTAFVIALFKVKTVNLAQLAAAFPGPAEIDSHYRRLQRFFKSCASKTRQKPVSPWV